MSKEELIEEIKLGYEIINKISKLKKQELNKIIEYINKITQKEE